MKKGLQILLIIFILAGCKLKEITHKDYYSENLKIERIQNNVFKHTSYLETKSLGTVPCNGMIYINGNDAIVFDTPVNDKASSELIDWIGDKTIKAIVATHFHIDCLGALDAFHAKGIKSYATSQTIALAKENNTVVLPQIGFDKNYEFQIGNKNVIAKYYGQGHTKDNIIGYIPSEKALFGGCLIKSLNAPKGNLLDANTYAWPKTIEILKNELQEIDIVIPGHGKHGDTALLNYTIDLFKEQQGIVFFLHNRFLETHELTDTHPEYGRVQYNEIIGEFEKNELKVISEKRDGNVNARDYAQGIIVQIDSLLSSGVSPNKITVVGTSKGGYIAQYVSTLANNPDLNFVFVASFQNSDIQNLPNINLCGNILNIFEKSDPFGVSAIERKLNSDCKIENFKDIELSTGMGHGFLFKPLKEWIEPTIKWAKGNYELK